MDRNQRRLALWQAFVTFYLTLTAGAALSDWIGQKVAGMLALVGAALNAGTGVYMSTIRTPQPSSSAQVSKG